MCVLSNVHNMLSVHEINVSVYARCFVYVHLAGSLTPLDICVYNRDVCWPRAKKCSNTEQDWKLLPPVHCESMGPMPIVGGWGLQEESSCHLHPITPIPSYFSHGLQPPGMGDPCAKLTRTCNIGQPSFLKWTSVEPVEV